MPRPQDFITSEIDLVAAIMVATDNRPVVRPGSRLVEFVLTDSDEIRNVSSDYAAGRLMLDAKRFAGIRARLFKIMAEVSRCRQEVTL